MLSSKNLIKFIVLLAVVCVDGRPTYTMRKRAYKPYESPYRFEGDIKIPSGSRGGFRLGESVRWPDGIVPFEIGSEYGPDEVKTILGSMRLMEELLAVNNKQCIQFRPKKPSDEYYIIIKNEDGCAAHVGRDYYTGRNRVVSLAVPGCMDKGTIMHEFMHTLGFYHEQSRPDRDKYVRIILSNIEPGMEYNFEKYDTNSVDIEFTPYDYESIMHYEWDAFSVNGLPTIEPVQKGMEVGQRDTLSPIDIQEIRHFYGCDEL